MKVKVPEQPNEGFFKLQGLSGRSSPANWLPTFILIISITETLAVVYLGKEASVAWQQWRGKTILRTEVLVPLSLPNSNICQVEAGKYLQRNNFIIQCSKPWFHRFSNEMTAAIYSHRLASQVENHELVSNHIAIIKQMQYNVIEESLCQDRPRQIRGRLNLVWCALRRSLQRKS